MEIAMENSVIGIQSNGKLWMLRCTCLEIMFCENGIFLKWVFSPLSYLLFEFWSLFECSRNLDNCISQYVPCFPEDRVRMNVPSHYYLHDFAGGVSATWNSLFYFQFSLTAASYRSHSNCSILLLPRVQMTYFSSGFPYYFFKLYL